MEGVTNSVQGAQGELEGMEVKYDLGFFFISEEFILKKCVESHEINGNFYIYFT